MNTPTVMLDPTGNLRVSFAYDMEIVTRIKTVPGAAWVKAGKYWALPLSSLDRLIAEFGDDLAIHPDVVMAASDRTPAMVFADVLRQAGITLTDVDGRLVGSGGCYCADPWQRLIDERADQLRRLAPVTVVTKPTSLPTPPAADLSKLTEFDKLAAANWDKWVKNQAEEDAVKKAAKNRRWAKKAVTE